jgi:hypothetical protein
MAARRAHRFDETPSLFSKEEQAALALTAAATLGGREGVPDGMWEGAAKHFVEVEIVSLLMAIATINVWNRLAVSTDQALPDLPSWRRPDLECGRGEDRHSRAPSGSDRCAVPPSAGPRSA